MTAVRDFLVRGLLAGLVAGIAAFGVAYTVGEPSVRAAIALEASAGQAHDQAHDHGSGQEGSGNLDTGGADETAVPRSLQSTVGLLTGTAVAGVTFGGLLGVLTALALGRFGRTGARATALAGAAIGFVALYAVPFAGYPPNPPGVGESDTIGVRTAVFFVLMAVSVLAGVVAILVGRHLASRWGGWYTALAATAGYVAVVAASIALLPHYEEVPADFPAALLYSFRAGSFLTQLTLWAVLGLTLAELLHRLTGKQPPSTAEVPLPHPVVRR